MSFAVYYNSQDNNSHVWANQHFQTSSCKRYPELITIATGSPFLCRAPPPPGSGEAEQRTPSTVLSIRGPGLFTTFPRCGFLLLSTKCSFYYEVYSESTTLPSVVYKPQIERVHCAAGSKSSFWGVQLLYSRVFHTLLLFLFLSIIKWSRKHLKNLKPHPHRQSKD